MSDTIKSVEDKNGVIVISTSGYFNNIAGDAVLEVFTEKMDSEEPLRITRGVIYDGWQQRL